MLQILAIEQGGSNTDIVCLSSLIAVWTLNLCPPPPSSGELGIDFKWLDYPEDCPSTHLFGFTWDLV